MRGNNQINAGSMADIAFLLLIFFLVATTIENPKGIQVMLPKITADPPAQINEKRVLTVKINKANQVMVESKYCRLEDVSDLVIKHVNERLLLHTQPIISLVTDTSAVYHTYISVYDEIKSAYTQLRNKSANQLFGKNFDLLEKIDRDSIKRKIPLVISEADYYKGG